MSLSWIFYGLTEPDLDLGDGDINGNGRKNFEIGIIVAIHAGLLFLTLIITVFNKFKLSYKSAIIYLTFFVVFIASSICLMEINK